MKKMEQSPKGDLSRERQMKAAGKFKGSKSTSAAAAFKGRKKSK